MYQFGGFDVVCRHLHRGSAKEMIRTSKTTSSVNYLLSWVVHIFLTCLACATWRFTLHNTLTTLLCNTKGWVRSKTERVVSLPTFSSGVSLWLVPAAAQMDVIKSGLPKRPSIDHPLSPSSYPSILPHITLATVPFSNPGIPDVLLEAVPDNQQPIRANFQSLVVGDHYFRSVFIDIQPTQELVDFQNQISINLRRRGIESRAPRFPHLSLCYIADEDGSNRGRTAQALSDTDVVSRVAGAQVISLRCGDVSLSGFDGVEVWMVNCEGPVETWQVNERKVKLAPKS